MKAIVYERYGAPDVLTLRDVNKPVPKDSEVLVRISASCVNSADIRMRAFDIPPPFQLPARLMLGWPTPKNQVLGVDFAGTVETVGAKVTRFRAGDRVYGLAVYRCHAEYRTVPETASIAKIPDGVSEEDAAAVVFGGHTALHFLNKAGIKPGQRVLISGASGAIGTMAVQMAKAMGAEVTAVASGRNMELLRSLGADHAVDYTSSDVTENGVLYDVIFDTIGTLSFTKVRGSLTTNGCFLGAPY